VKSELDIRGILPDDDEACLFAIKTPHTNTEPEFAGQLRCDVLWAAAIFTSSSRMWTMLTNWLSASSAPAPKLAAFGHL
jgi:hypothetical protein